MNSARFAVNHPVTISMMMILMVLLGVICIMVADVELLPDISVPTLVVVTNRPQSSPQDMQEDITIPLEDVLNRTTNLKSISSISLEGQSRVQLEFVWGTDVDMAMMEVREKLNSVKLPEDAKDPFIWRWDPSSEPIFRFDIYDSSGKGSLAALKRKAEDKIKPRLERLDGVGSVTVFGGEEEEVEVRLDPELLKAKGVTYKHVLHALKSESVSRRGGRVEGDGLSQSVRILAEAESPEDVRNIVVVSKPETVRVKDLGEVLRTPKEAETRARINKQPTIGITIKKSSGASTVAVIERIQEQLAELRRSGIMSSIITEVSQDDSEYILQAQDIAVNNILQGTVLAGLLLFFFLRNIPSTIIVAVMAPVSLISVFILMHVFGVSRNVLSLGGLALAGGMALDGAIVILESIYRHIEYGKSSREAAVQGSSEVRLAVIASGLTTVVAFLPVLFMAGIMNEIFRDLALAIVFTICVSTFVGLLFMPMMASRIIRAKSDRPREHGAFYEKLLMPVVRFVLRWLEALDRLLAGIVGGVLGFVLRSRLISVATVGLLLLASAISLMFLPGIDFLPKGRVEEVWITVEPPLGRTLDDSDETVSRIESALLDEDIDYVDKVASQVEVRESKLFVKLRPEWRDMESRFTKDVLPRLSAALTPEKCGETEWTFRAGRPGVGLVTVGFEGGAAPEGAADACRAALKGESWIAALGTHAQTGDGGLRFPVKVRYRREGVPEILNELRTRLADIPEVDIYVNLADKIGLGSGPPIEFKVSAKRPKRGSAGLEEVQNYVKTQLLPKVAAIDGAFYVRAEKTEKQTEISVKPIRKEAADKGVRTADISETIRAMVAGAKPIVLKDPSGDIDVKVLQMRRARGGKFTKDDLPDLEIPSSQGHYVRLSEVATRPSEKAEWKIERTDRKATATLKANLIPYEISGRTLGQIVADAKKAVETIPNQKDFPYALKSTAKDNEEAWETGFKAVAISVVLIYVIMCCQFESFLYPFAIMFTIPLASVGFVTMLHLTGETMSLGALVGLIALGGIVVNNGIILIEFINILRRRGVDRDEAIIQGSKMKLRSVLITSFTSILGMLPIVLGMGAGTELYKGCAAVMFGGLLASTPLTLIVLPVIYALLDELRDVMQIALFRVRAALGIARVGK